MLSTNKKGDIPTVILVLGVFIVCSLTLLNFYLVGVRDSGFFEGVLLIEAVSEIADDVRFYDELGKDSLELTELSERVERGRFKLKGEKIMKDKKEGYRIVGTFNETKWMGLREGDQLVSVKYEFPK